MKNTPLILSVIALVAVAVLAILQFTNGKCNKSTVSETAGETLSVSRGSIVYFNLDRILNEYDMANELRSAVESKIQGINQEVTRRGNKLQTEFNAFQEKINKGLITSSVAEIQGQKLQQQQNDCRRTDSDDESDRRRHQKVY